MERGYTSLGKAGLQHFQFWKILTRPPENQSAGEGSKEPLWALDSCLQKGQILLSDQEIPILEGWKYWREPDNCKRREISQGRLCRLLRVSQGARRLRCRTLQPWLGCHIVAGFTCHNRPKLEKSIFQLKNMLIFSHFSNQAMKLWKDPKNQLPFES